VPHLNDQVISYSLPSGDVFHVKVAFTSHCWTRSFDPLKDKDRMVVYHHRRPRAFCPVRYGASLGLVEMLKGLADHFICNASGRNYGAYNATVRTTRSEFYTVFLR
jgi:hypothetical protein